MKLSPKESPTLPRLRLEEVTGHHRVLRRWEALVRDHLRGRVPRCRRGRRGQERGHLQVVPVRQMKVSNPRVRG